MRGKYSPRCPNAGDASVKYNYNAYGDIAPDYDTADEYDEKLYFGTYDSDGFDSYGYSAYDRDGNYAGIGDGIDRLGNTEREYLLDEVLWEHAV